MSSDKPGAQSDSQDFGIESLLDYLLLIRRDFPRLEMYLGTVHVLSMRGFMAGFLACLGVTGTGDERYFRFREWLRATGELPPEGWDVKYLRDCGGDHARAIKKLLDLAAEFHEMELRGRC